MAGYNRVRIDAADVHAFFSNCGLDKGTTILNASSLIYWVLINYLPDQLMLQFIVPIVYIGFNWFIYSFVRAILRWHETPYTEESIPWHMKCLYKCILPLVYIATLLTVYLIIR